MRAVRLGFPFLEARQPSEVSPGGGENGIDGAALPGAFFVEDRLEDLFFDGFDRQVSRLGFADLVRQRERNRLVLGGQTLSAFERDGAIANVNLGQLLPNIQGNRGLVGVDGPGPATPGFEADDRTDQRLAPDVQDRDFEAPLAVDEGMIRSQTLEKDVFDHPDDPLLHLVQRPGDDAIREQE